MFALFVENLCYLTIAWGLAMNAVQRCTCTMYMFWTQDHFSFSEMYFYCVCSLRCCECQGPHACLKSSLEIKNFLRDYNVHEFLLHFRHSFSDLTHEWIFVPSLVHTAISTQLHSARSKGRNSFSKVSCIIEVTYVLIFIVRGNSFNSIKKKLHV